MTTLKEKIHRLYELVSFIHAMDDVDTEAQTEALTLIEGLLRKVA